MSTGAIIGDMGGDARLFEAMIAAVGGNARLVTLPDDLTVIQVGDLVRLAKARAPDSSECVAIADRFLKAYPSRWIQLWGNHDLAVLGGPSRPSWEPARDVVSSLAARTLQRWWDDGAARFAVAFKQYAGDVLVTHAGLTAQRWLDLSAPDAHTAAARLNEVMERSSPVSALRAGKLVTGVVDVQADCTWAEGNEELCLPWIELGRHRAIAFNQIHGHASPWDWNTDGWWTGTPREIKTRCVVDDSRRQTTTIVGMLASKRPATLRALNWDLEATTPPSPWRPFVTLATSIGDVFPLAGPGHPQTINPEPGA